MGGPGENSSRLVLGRRGGWVEQSEIGIGWGAPQYLGGGGR